MIEEFKVFKEMPISVGTDVPDKTALIVTFDCGCNLNCYKCHYNFSKDKMEKIDIETANKKIEKLVKTKMLDCIVLTGGELTLNSGQLYKYCKYLQTTYGIDVIVNTNGTMPSGIPSLLDIGVIFHVDIKMSKQNFDARERVIGFSLSPDEYLKRLFLTLNYIYKDSSNEHILRTVDYPINEICKSDESSMITYSKAIENMVQHLNSKYNKKLRWFLNDFYEFS